MSHAHSRRQSSLSSAVRNVVEALEGRTMLSVTIKTVEDTSGNPGLEIKGNSSTDNVLIIDDQTDNTIRVIANGKTTHYDGAPTFTILADLGGGNDTLEYRVISSGPFQTRSVHLDGDTGNDRITLNSQIVFDPGDDLDLNAVAGGFADFDILIDGDSGNDTISVSGTYIIDSNASIEINAGEGNDNVTLEFGAGRQATAQLAAAALYADDPSFFIDIDLGGGKNSLKVSSENVGVGSTLDVNIKGGNTTGSNVDTVDLEVGGYGAGKFFLDVNLGAGDDRLDIHGDLESGANPEPGEQTPVTRFNLNGGDGKDRMTVDLEEVYVDEVSYTNVQLKGGNGNDTLTFNIDGIFVQEGGTLIVGVDGQNNDDTINTAFTFVGGILNATPAGSSVRPSVIGVLSPGDVDIRLHGGQNSDKFNVYASFDGLNPSLSLSAPTPTGGPILVDGQSGGSNSIKFLPGTDTSLFDVRNMEKASY